MHYVDVEAASSYRYKADIGCTASSSDSRYSIYLSNLTLRVLFMRYLNQAGDPVDANNCSASNDCTQDEIILPLADTLNCMDDDIIQIDQLIPFRAPASNGQKDLIVVTTILSPDVAAVDLTNPAVLEEYQTAGTHTATMGLSAEVSLKPNP